MSRVRYNLTACGKERFFNKVNQGQPDECWEWQAGTDRDGYGRFWLDGRHEQAHRVAYCIENGELPEVVRHACDNPSCCNPAHLEGGTQKDNMRDRCRRDCTAKGSHNGRAKLDAETVRELRRRQKREDVTYQNLAEEVGVSYWTVKDAILGKTWAHV